MNWLEVRCPTCHKLLLKINGLCCIIEVACPKCKLLVRWPVLAAEVVPRRNVQRVKEAEFEG